MKTFHSWDELEEYLFPERCEKRKMDAMSPSELGGYLAKKSIDRISKEEYENHRKENYY